VPVLDVILIYLATGALAGFVSGLFGVGGSFTMAPALIIALPLQGAPEDHVMHLTVGTALAVMTVTSAWVAVLRWRAGDLYLPLMARFVPFIAGGALLGAAVGDALPNLMLKVLFIGFIALTVVRGVFYRGHAAIPGGGDLGAVRGPALWGYGALTGFTGSLLGPGPAIIIAPWLRKLRYPMPIVSATASALAALVGLASAAGYIWTGANEVGLPEWSLGYLFLPAFIGLATGAFIGSPFGIRFSHKVPDMLLHRAFISYLALLMVVMIVQTVMKQMAAG
jgi:uncharacterized membrane protein YfcA